MTALALEVLNTPMGPYLNLMEEMTMEQKLALVAFLINTMQHEDPKKKTSDEEFVKELMALRYEGEMSAEELKQMLRESRRQALKKDMTPEQLYSLISEEIDDIYANG